MSASPETRERAIDFMDRSGFISLVNNNLAGFIFSENETMGSYKSSRYDGSKFLIKLPLSSENNPLNLLRQMEWIRRELRDGQVPEEGSMERLFADVEIEMAASRFYEQNRDIVDLQIGVEF